ncbi:MAG: nucleoside-triphosphatase [Armatimonadota bacterium]|nr:nucleoside-triphosphatase [Armatimonadota bacterium]MDR7548724.1 nucleoside-triphosphatase [Armatimonadota bacterium]
MADILLIAGRPGVGKTTLVRGLADTLGRRAAGFYTEEIRASGARVGFRLVTLDGRAAVFAHVDWAKTASHRVGRYGVDLAALERFGLPAIRRGLRGRRVILVDEIGKMELASEAFQTVMDEVAASPALLVATITVAPHPWSDAFKRRPGTTLYELTRANRDRVLEAARTWLDRRGPERRKPRR